MLLLHCQLPHSPPLSLWSSRVPRHVAYARVFASRILFTVQLCPLISILSTHNLLLPASTQTPWIGSERKPLKSWRCSNKKRMILLSPETPPGRHMMLHWCKRSKQKRNTTPRDRTSCKGERLTQSIVKPSNNLYLTLHRSLPTTFREFALRNRFPHDHDRQTMLHWAFA